MSRKFTKFNVLLHIFPNTAISLDVFSIFKGCSRQNDRFGEVWGGVQGNANAKVPGVRAMLRRATPSTLPAKPLGYTIGICKSSHALGCQDPVPDIAAHMLQFVMHLRGTCTGYFDGEVLD